MRMAMAGDAPAPCVTAALLERNAARWPELVVLKFDSGERFTTVELLDAARSRAAGLQALGVQQGEFVLSWFANGPVAVLNWLALNLLGAVYVPLNTAYRGNLLQHVIATSNASLMLADGKLIERLADVRTGGLTRIVVSGAARPALHGIALLDTAVLAGNAADLIPPPQPVRPRDTQCVIFTSGTTGPSKGVLCSYRHTSTAAVEFRHVGPGDTNLVALPMFHIGGILGVNFALIHGGTAAVVERFRTQTFWETVRALDVTVTGLLGTMVQFLMQQPAQPGERVHPLQKVVIAPFGDEALAFAERFNVEVFTEFNMTELSVPLWAGPGAIPRGSCGRPRQGVMLRLVDDNDEAVATGAVGELILRPDEPWTLCDGYLNDPAATARAWRNGWFHTGDLFRRDADDNYFFVDRARDMIRRRGENISSFEVEAELLAFPGVRAAAAVPVPGADGEDEVLAVLSLQPGARLEPAELIDFLRPRMAAFMIPRYVRVVPELPLTPTQKIEKHVLRAAGVTADTWDRGTGRLQEAGTARAAASVAAPRTESIAPRSRGALAGVRVLEFSGLGPAPFCTMLLSDLGADALCIDRPGASYAASDVEARGRTRVQLDLKNPAQQAQAMELADRADILIEGFRPGVMERLGLGPQVLLPRNPRLVYGRMTGWGQSGPLADKAGHDLNYLALTGALHALGTQEKPAVPLNLIGDFGGGALYLALGVLAALHHARATGTGQVVDAAMTDGVISLLGMIYGDFADGRWVDERESNPIDGAAPFYNVYRCRDDKWLSVAAIEPQFYRNLLQALVDAGVSLPSPIPQMLATQWRRDSWPDLHQIFAAAFSGRTRDEWCELFAACDACVAPVLSLAEAPHHPHNLARRSFIEVAGIAQPAAAPRLNITAGAIQGPPHQPAIGIDAALRRWLPPK
jgi:crotonobetaine/carnitine-CoA ligase